MRSTRLSIWILFPLVLEFQIYSNSLFDPVNASQTSSIITATGDFTIFSEEYTDLRDRVTITGGNVGSFNYMEVGCDDTLFGTALSKGTLFLRERARIYGDALSGQTVNKQNKVYIQGIEKNYVQMELPSLVTLEITSGTTDISVPAATTYTLVPGSYNVFYACADVSLIIQPGEYSFRKFILEQNVTMLCAVESGNRIDLFIKDRCSLGNGTTMALPEGITDFNAVSIRSAQTEQLYIGTDATIRGLVYAPDAEVHVYSRSKVYGSLYGRSVVLEPDMKGCTPPALLGLSHSEVAMAPPFDPIVFNYRAVVSETMTSIKVIPGAKADQTVTINGNPPEVPVNLTGTETN